MSELLDLAPQQAPLQYIPHLVALPRVEQSQPEPRGGHLLKRAFDITVASALILVLLPVLVVVGVAVKLTSPGPVLFRQERVGRAARPFHMLKFRSMVVDAEARLVSLADVQRREGNHVMFKMKDDPRVTRVGRFIRRFSLDELPQLFNVLEGSMSLVGPRPPLPREVVTYQDHVHRRFEVKPGVTGLWQVSGRSRLSWDESVRLDLHYVDNWSFWYDFGILLRTFKAVIARDGAF